MTSGPLAAALIGATLGAAAVAQEQAAPEPFDVDTRMGVLCSLALVHTLEAVGRRCMAEADPAFQAALSDAAARLETHVLASAAMTPDELAGFRRSMAGDIQSDAAICGGDGARLYGVAREGGAERLRAHVDRQVARPGPPAWGACL